MPPPGPSAEQLLEKIAQASAGVLHAFRMGADGSFSFVYAGPGVEELYGFPAAALKHDGSLAIRRTHPDDRERVEQSIATAASAGAPWCCEFRYNHPTRGEIWIEGRSMAELQPDGAMIWHGVLTDITQRKRAEEHARRQTEHALHESEERLQLIFEQLVAGIWTTDVSLVVTSIKGYRNRIPPESRGAIVGMHVAQLLADPAAAQRAVAAHQRALAGETTMYEAPFEESTYRCWVAPFRDAGGALIGVIGFAIDFTEQLAGQHQLNSELEARVAARTAELENANHELEAFSYSVSHDLRAPLRTVDGFAQALLEDCEHELSGDARRYINVIREGAQRMGMLIDDLLAFSRLGRLQVRRRLLDTREVVEDCLESMRAEQQARKIEVAIGELPESQADPALLSQVWSNLLSNAFKYTRTRERPRIEIGCAREGADDIFFVRDNGVGFDPCYAHKVFKVFERLHRSEEFEGTGVGLAIVHRIVTRHGGRVWADAAPDGGATFSFTLAPATPNEHEHPG